MTTNRCPYCGGGGGRQLNPQHVAVCPRRPKSAPQAQPTNPTGPPVSDPIPADANYNGLHEAFLRQQARIAAEAENPLEQFLFPPNTPTFHGTEHDFQPGDIITPRSKKVAHATVSLRTARVFGSKVYEVEIIDPSTTWDDKMKHTGIETHYERLSDVGFRVVSGPIPKYRKSEYYDARRQAAHEQWQADKAATDNEPPPTP